MSRRCRSLVAGCVLAAVALSVPARADPEKLPGMGPLARAARGLKDILISPLEIPATVRRVAEEHDAFRGLWAGTLEGIGNGLMRLTAGVVELLTCPIPSDTLPLYNKRLGERGAPPARPPTSPTRP